MDQKGLVFEVQGFSVHDGPGCRTQVFLSGCPLRCEWCANPEGMKQKQQLLFSRQKCRYEKNHCRRCLDACGKGAIQETGDPQNPLQFRREICENCKTFECAAVCAHEAARVSGQYKTVEEIMRIFRRDREYWDEKGGPGFSGGEPMAQREFLCAVLRACKQEGMNTSIETTASVDTATFLEVMEWIDFAFIDVKHMDTHRHREKTGIGNERILSNIEALARSSWPGRLVLRMPVIRDFNDTVENAKATADFMERLGLYEINILPFHRLGTSKWEQLGREYPYSQDLPTEEAILEQIQNYYLERRIACYVGDDVLY
ncbi:MAG: 4-hydroxyphenylacetate decarboxylase activase [Blautia sp.]